MAPHYPPHAVEPGHLAEVTQCMAVWALLQPHPWHTPESRVPWLISLPLILLEVNFSPVLMLFCRLQSDFQEYVPPVRPKSRRRSRRPLVRGYDICLIGANNMIGQSINQSISFTGPPCRPMDLQTLPSNMSTMAWEHLNNYKRGSDQSQPLSMVVECVYLSSWRSSLVVGRWID